MKAIVSTRYGSPASLALREVEKPAVSEDGVRVRVRAASVNAYDWHMMRGKPYIARLGRGLRKPKRADMGLDAAGVVDAVGRDVTHVQPGDEVFGAHDGAFAEYVSGVNFVPMPAGLAFEQAAAVPLAGCTALQALRDKVQVQPGQKVMIIGAGGGVGTFAVQIAKAFGATVTAVTSTAKVDMIRSLGADHVIDYTAGDITRTSEHYDVMIDVAGGRKLSLLRRALTLYGTLVLVGPGSGQWLGPVTQVLTALVMSRFGDQRMVPFLAKTTKEDLLALKTLIETGRLKPVLDRAYPLSETPEAIRYLETGQAQGKVVITV